MIACATDHALCMLEFTDRSMLELQLRRVQKRLKAIFLAGSNAILEKTAQELDRYFTGSLHEFTVPLTLAGSNFQTSVWKRLQDIPYGGTSSYRDVAVDLKAPNSVRAVGRANGDNCIAIIVPCHRVVGSNGDLTGYGGGLWRKRRLLEIEGKRK